MKMRFAGEENNAEPTWESPSSGWSSMQGWWALPQRCPDLCQTAGSLLPLCRAHPASAPLYFLFPAAALVCAQTPLIFYF